MPVISIILPVFNGIKYLRQSVDSVLNQNFTDFEFLIVDDCSTDGSWDYLLSIKDERVSIFRNEQNRGLFFSLNFLIKKTTSPIVKLWSQDDVLYYNCISEVVEFHKEHTQIGFSYTGRSYIDAAGNDFIINQKDDTPVIVSPMLHAKIAFSTGSIAGNIANVALNRGALENVGLFNEQMKICGDFEMWVRLAKDYPVGFIREQLVQLRSHDEQLSRQEKYYIYHLKEDIQVYNILLGYVSEEGRKEGRLLLHNNKLLFYYTLMVKALLRGKIKTVWEFCKCLHQFDNIFLLSGTFIKRLIKRQSA